jgi:ligand-binding SRPBCC domain-containing protein
MAGSGGILKVYTLEARQTLPRPIDEVFPFFASPHNLETITPPWLSFQIGSAPGLEMSKGLLINYRLKIHGFPLRWRSEITAWEPPHRFVDEQRRGPYRMWHHEHRFEAFGDNTVVSDTVRYAVWGGALIRNLFVVRDVEKIFDYRRKKLAEIFPAYGRER